jgi:hypothetical protein
MKNRGDSEEKIQERIQYYRDIKDHERNICNYLISGEMSLDFIVNTITEVVEERRRRCFYIE